MRQAVQLKIYAVWKKEEKLWVATSPVVSGLTVKADTLAELEDRLNEIIPELAELIGVKNEAALIVNGVL